MEIDPHDIDVVAHLTKLRSSTEIQYPPDLFASRRLEYTKKVTEIGLGLSIGAGIGNATKANSSGGLTGIGGLFEKILVAAIVVEAGAAVYFYRAEIADVIQSDSPSVLGSESVSEPVDPSSMPAVVGTENPQAIEPPRDTPTNTPTATATVVPTVVEQTFEADQAISTPDLKDNNGNQYGKTPMAERTKDKNNNDNGGGKDKDKDK